MANLKPFRQPVWLDRPLYIRAWKPFPSLQPSIVTFIHIPPLCLPQPLLLLNGPAQSTTTLIIVLTVLISDLTARLAATILSALLKTRIKICPDDTLVQLGAADVLHTVKSVLMSVVFHKAKATWCLVKSVEAHNQSLDLAAFAEQFVDLLFGGVE